MAIYARDYPAGITLSELRGVIDVIIHEWGAEAAGRPVEIAHSKGGHKPAVSIRVHTASGRVVLDYVPSARRPFAED